MGMADEKGERQLFEYCFHRGVPIAVLTDGRTWKLFYPAGEGSYTDRLFCGMDLIDGDAAEIANDLIRYLAYSAVKSGEARRRAQEDCKAGQQQRHAVAKFSSVWNKLLLEPDPTLVELFEERDGTFCKRFAEREYGRSRKYVARSKRDLYPEHPELLIKDAFELPGGWWIGTHSSNAQKRKWIWAACEVAGIEFDRDIIVRMP